MGLCCKQHALHQYDIQVHSKHLAGAHRTSLHNRLRFVLLASHWFPEPIGICLWSVLHAVLAAAATPLVILAAGVVFVASVLLNVVVLIAILFGIFSIYAVLLSMVPFMIIVGWISGDLVMLKNVWTSLYPRNADCSETMKCLFPLGCVCDKFLRNFWRVWWGVVGVWWEEAVHINDAIAI